MWEPFHVGLGPQPMHLDITPEFGQLPNFETNKYGERGMVVVDPLPTHSMCMLSKPHICSEWMWEPFHVGLGPQLGPQQCTLTSYM